MASPTADLLVAIVLNAALPMTARELWLQCLEAEAKRKYLRTNMTKMTCSKIRMMRSTRGRNASVLFCSLLMTSRRPALAAYSNSFYSPCILNVSMASMTPRCSKRFRGRTEPHMRSHTCHEFLNRGDMQIRRRWTVVKQSKRRKGGGVQRPQTRFTCYGVDSGWLVKAHDTTSLYAIL